MLKLIIVDDEKIIRETIHNIIDWNTINIEVIGLCKNGIEAYDMILDESPDIILTDIKMPGLSGLELIKRVSEFDKQISFVILSGYGEFSLAAEAMKYGIKHYLLKPCNESQIIEVMTEVTKDCYAKRERATLEEQYKLMNDTVIDNALRNYLLSSLLNSMDYNELLCDYEQYIDFTNTSYRLYYIYYLEEWNLNEYLTKVYHYIKRSHSNLTIYPLYVKNTLMFFFEDKHANIESFDEDLRHISLHNMTIPYEVNLTIKQNLTELMKELTYRFKRYEVIYYINGLHLIPMKTYDTQLQNMEKYVEALCQSSSIEQTTNILAELKEYLTGIDDLFFLKTIISNLVLRLANQLHCENEADLSAFLLLINENKDASTICNTFFEKLPTFFPTCTPKRTKYKVFVEKTIDFIEEHLSDSTLTLKWIAENHLYMNVDYLSKQFLKETGCKFSAYLNNARIERAKVLLLEQGMDHIYEIAEEVGCGNNPQYFSQLFKRYTGVSPSVYIKENM